LVKIIAHFWCIDFWGKNALHIACEFGHVNIIDYLMNECNMDINTPNPSNQFTPFHYAVFNNHYKAVQYLVNNGTGIGTGTSTVNINLRCSKGSALHLATTMEMAQCLVDHGNIDINIQDGAGCTALHEAISWDRVSMIKYLINLSNIIVDT
jgi:ankyrin repeat protein